MNTKYLNTLAASVMLAATTVSAGELPKNGPAKNLNTTAPTKVSQEVLPVSEVLESIPSPLEISVLIKESGTIYNKADLNAPEAVSRYNTGFQKAINLGIYGTDLGFANIYGKNQDAISFLNSVRDLADGLGIGAFFDYETIKELAESSNRLDELIQQTTLNFEKINNNLRERKRENVSVLILTGGWIEAVYLTTVINQREPNDLLKDKIGDQKVVLDQLLLVLDIYKSSPGFEDLINDLTALQEIYDQIEVEVIVGEPTMEEIDGVLVVTDGTRSVVHVTDTDIQKITSLLKSIRNKVIR
ncbi:hypothetical protein KMW28_07770 [Flammeovirga yaeyamensis]|uniref:Uncharacterized protein n=1 Tax=Flammeovirga yaeyamensis TaxID=367791 RepID=A0AAX1NCT7_9BACT|nr:MULTISPECIES: hypothetical protein [Flammeovirga]ANQ49057.1 hypothetical protein MY04_1683 [Flammeovirga sp. MY04]MBB3699138.1 hypothetical protein [Flammeovirga yaeyamensis]NMF36571.1 hypothetical protein [Flammeovirga yaeyamensis]QWG03473.1 hypothetical protein KMW28_07770 [Flammeovirga yaeyamensis]